MLTYIRNELECLMIFLYAKSHANAYSAVAIGANRYAARSVHVTVSRSPGLILMTSSKRKHLLFDHTNVDGAPWLATQCLVSTIPQLETPENGHPTIPVRMMPK